MKIYSLTSGVLFGLLPALTLLAALTGATAQTVSITNTATNFAPSSSDYVSLELDQFDQNLGILQDVTVRVNSANTSGFFTLFTTTQNVTVFNALNALTIRQDPTNSLGFTQLGQTFFTLDLTTPPPFSVPLGTTTNISINPSQAYFDVSESIDSGFWSAYQSLTPGKIAFQVNSESSLGVIGGVFTVESTNVVTETSMSVVYTYVVPEPSTYALFALAALGLAAYGWRRCA